MFWTKKFGRDLGAEAVGREGVGADHGRDDLLGGAGGKGMDPGQQLENTIPKLRA